MVLRTTALVLLVLMVGGGTAGEPAAWAEEEGSGHAALLAEVPEEFREDVAKALGQAGENAAALAAAFEKLDAEEREGWAFLVANMPAGDLRSVPEATLTEHVEYAYRARRELPWTKGVPRALFFHYVLPFRSAQEPVEAWRKQFFETMVPRLAKAGCETLEEVALEVNRYCGENVKFKPTGPKDRSPLAVLESGFGRCEEEMIFFNAVARSVGVPARSVFTPYWPFQDNNHAWCEVYTGKSTRPGAGGWHYLGACEPKDALDQAWFTRATRRAALVLARCMGRAEGENVFSYRDKTTIINSTPVYTATCRMTLRVVTGEGEPVPRSVVHLYVFNFGSLRPILGRRTDGEGRTTFDLGPGDYVVTGAGNGKMGFAVAHSVVGGEATCDVVLGSDPPDEAFWLRYPVPEK